MKSPALWTNVIGSIVLSLACTTAHAQPAKSSRPTPAKPTSAKTTPAKSPQVQPARPGAQPAQAVKAFVAVQPDAALSLPPIVVQYDATTGSGFDWKKLSELPYYQALNDPGRPMLSAVRYLREAVQRMTGKELPVVAGNDLTRGIVLTTLEGAPPELKKDPAVIAALKNSGADAYNSNEAYYVRSEPNRVIIVANTAYGISHGIIELLESVGYEALSMGPNWTHVPDYKNKPLSFSIQRSGRPGFYLRSLWPTSGQGYGVGTLHLMPLADAADETVEVSLDRWQVGARIAGQSMAGFPGHALQGYHRAVVQAMRESKTTDGFLVEKTHLGLEGERPAAAKENNGHLWLNTDAEGQPAAGKVFMSDGTKWIEQDLASLNANLDLSVPMVRQIILNDMKQKAEESFTKNPDEIFVFGTDPEDGGGYASLAALLSNKNWYPEYLAAENVKFGQPYVLHEFKGLNQPREIWDSNAPSDTVFGFDNWLLREFDKWIDSRPQQERVTSNGKPKKSMVRISGYSYNYHDVPPNFNLDPRIRVMIAGYPKHRGWGKWKNFSNQIEMAKAFQVMLPREPSGDYWIISLSYFWDSSSHGISGSESAATIQRKIKEEYDAGFKALSVETDFNFGKLGLAYYLYSKALWNPGLTAAQLDAIRDRWLQRAFGSGWRNMKAYYDFMTPDNFTINAPNNWAKAIRFIDAADKQVDDVKEPAAQRRIDDVKQFWYFYYLQESGKGKADAREMREFAWKGQMSYMTAMHMVTRTIFNTNSAKDAAGPEFNTGPAHYTHEETQAWWAKMLDFWPVTPVTNFTDVTLANGKKGKDVDLNDLVMVGEFQASQGSTQPADVPFLYNSGYMKTASFLTVAAKAGDEIGFKLFWPWNPNDNYYRDRDVSYGISRWNTATKKWDELVDKTMAAKHSSTVKFPDGGDKQLAEIRYAAPQPGTYRVEVGYGGNLAQLTTLGYDINTGQYSGARGHTYFSTLEGLTQSGVYLYIPKGTKSFDMEVWDTYGVKSLVLHTGLPATGLTRTRTVDVGKRGTHTVALNPGEDGSIALLQGNGFSFPYLYSVPMLWAKSPSALLVPRAVAHIDGLTQLR